MSIEQKIVGSCFLFVLTVGTGIWLSSLGKPYNTVVFTFHKLISLAAIILITILIYNLFMNAEIKTLILPLITVSGLSVSALFISGILLSIGRAPDSLLKTVHSVAPVITVITTAIAIYLLVSKK